ncbi:uncharacterized protein LOC105773882 [Gossypium raimondii]|uniref:LysM domain-containing protein n=2 Tax=Gossypium raimondii TaxID=29730 RepID=A0A0D2NGQ2_GOSRA|nr:uncharacterized protein LOC105773882 [Gossypium raimondii]KJB12388.1 hypothetical protein B456_002G015700 [Gossypium raimondii]
MERERCNSIANGDYSYSANGIYSEICNDYSILEKERDQSSPDPSLRGNGYIEHPVSRFDTMAGVAIKYGVEVADIKKMNGLVTDFQMFALKSIQIPLPGRHPPSPCSSNGCEAIGQNNVNQTTAQHLPPDLLDSFQSLKTTHRRVSPAMSSLQGFYALKSTERNTVPEGFEMAVYRKGETHFPDDSPFLKPSSASYPSLKLHRNCKNKANAFFDENGEVGTNVMSVVEAAKESEDKSNEKLFKRRPKSEADCTPEKLLEDNTSTGGFSTITSKGLALRTKAASRTNLLIDAEVGFNPASIGIGDGFVVDKFSAVRKSYSTSNLQDQDGSTSLSSPMTAPKWSRKPDLQPLSTAAITASFFDGLSMPMSARKNKAALD